MSFLTVSQCVKKYGTTIVTTAIDHVDLRIEQGEFTSISGPSGSGKTTLLNMIGGLDTPDSGEITLSNHRISSMKASELASIRLHHIGFVFQAYNLIPVFTAMENIEYILMMQGVDKENRRERIHEIAEELEISDLLNKRPNQMSGGQQQRVAVARAIASKPKLVLADEPTANLDTKRANRLMTLMKKMNEIHNITFIFSTHDQRVMALSDRNIHLEDGRIVEDKLSN
tara:strand:- start:4025 stop:4708 length:684 start_codon:yes stop_codon:yes gene_type:complete